MNSEVEEFIKRAYEEVVLESIADFEGINVWVHNDMKSSDSVCIIDMYSGEANGLKSNLTVIYTEEDRRGGYIEIENKDHLEEADYLFKKYSTGNMYITGTRKWYEDYLIPKIKVMADVMEI